MSKDRRNKLINATLVVIYIGALIACIFDGEKKDWIALMVASFFAGPFMILKSGREFVGQLFMIPAALPVVVILINFKNLVYAEPTILSIASATGLSYFFSGVFAILILVIIIREVRHQKIF